MEVTTFSLWVWVVRHMTYNPYVSTLILTTGVLDTLWSDPLLVSVIFRVILFRSYVPIHPTTRIRMTPLP